MLYSNLYSAASQYISVKLEENLFKNLVVLRIIYKVNVFFPFKNCLKIFKDEIIFYFNLQLSQIQKLL